MPMRTWAVLGAHLPVQLHPKGVKPVYSEAERWREKTTAKEVK